MGEAICKHCRFWKRYTDSRFGDARHGNCRYDPPVVLVLGSTTTSKWPHTYEDDWCGKHEENDT